MENTINLAESVASGKKPPQGSRTEGRKEEAFALPKGKGLLSLLFFLSLIVVALPGRARPAPLPSGGGKLPATLHARSDEFLFRTARNYFRGGHDRLALQAVNMLLKDHPGSVLQGPALLLRARIEARRSIRRGDRDFRGPLVLFRQAGKAPPPGWDKGEVLFRMGQYLVRKRFGVEGRGLLERLRSENPQSPWSYRALLSIADSYRQKGDLLRAEKRLLMADPEKYPGPVTKNDRLRWLYLAGHLKLDRGDVPGAGEDFLAALSLSHDYPYSHPESLFLLGRYAYRAHHDLRAVILFRRFIRLFPNDSRLSLAMYYRARLSGRLGHPDREKGRLRELTLDEPGTSGSHMATIRLIEMTFPEKSPPKGAWDTSLLSRSLSLLKKISEEETHARIVQRASLLRISLLSRSGHPNQALRELIRISEGVDPQTDFGRRLEALKGQVTLARALALAHPLRPHRLLEVYRVSRREIPPPSDPSSAPLYLALARAYRKTGEAEKADRLIDNVLSHATDPTLRDRAARRKFSWLLADKKIAMAMNFALVRAEDTTLAPPLREGWFDTALKEAVAGGDSEGERRVLEAWEASGVPEKDPDRLRARLGLLEIDAGKTDRGRKLLLEALPGLEIRSDARPELAESLYRLGEMAREEGDLSTARKDWEKFLDCCRGNPQGGWVMYQLGQAALSEGRQDEALDWFKKTVKGYPGQDVAKLAGMKITELTLEKRHEGP
ncbi:MAG: tetratricopeptide repeat protein [Leptospirillia bacterium]